MKQEFSSPTDGICRQIRVNPAATICVRLRIRVVYRRRHRNPKLLKNSHN
ncbi:hypothetical protein [Nostoc sp.]